MHILFFPSDSTFGIAKGINTSSAKLRPASIFTQRQSAKLSPHKKRQRTKEREPAALVPILHS